MSDRHSPYMTVPEVADYMGVHMNTVKRIPPEELPYFRFGTRGDRRYEQTDVDAYIRGRKITHSAPPKQPVDLLGRPKNGDTPLT